MVSRKEINGRGEVREHTGGIERESKREEGYVRRN